jgi:Protein of unknown function (DUF3606)
VPTLSQHSGTKLITAHLFLEQAETTMTVDDKSNRGEPDRRRVSGSEDYEVAHFAKHHGITQQQARELIARHGNNRKELVEALSRVKGAS